MTEIKPRRGFIPLAERNKKAAPAPVHRMTLLIALAGLALSIFNATQGWQAAQLERRMQVLTVYYQEQQILVSLVAEIGKARASVYSRLRGRLSVAQRASDEARVQRYTQRVKGFNEQILALQASINVLSRRSAWTMSDAQAAQTVVVKETLNRILANQLADAKEETRRKQLLTQRTYRPRRPPARGAY